MNNDLVSRELVIETLQEIGIITGNDLGNLAIEEINKIPTAYNIDNVIKQIHDFYMYCNITHCDHCEFRKYGCRHGTIDKIVKEGGVNES